MMLNYESNIIINTSNITFALSCELHFVPQCFIFMIVMYFGYVIFLPEPEILCGINQKICRKLQGNNQNFYMCFFWMEMHLSRERHTFSLRTMSRDYLQFSLLSIYILFSNTLQFIEIFAI